MINAISKETSEVKKIPHSIPSVSSTSSCSRKCQPPCFCLLLCLGIELRTRYMPRLSVLARVARCRYGAIHYTTVVRPCSGEERIDYAVARALSHLSQMRMRIHKTTPIATVPKARQVFQWPSWTSYQRSCYRRVLHQGC